MAVALEVMTPEQVAAYLQVNTATVYRYIRDRKLEASRLGRRYRITREAVDRFLRASSNAPEVREALFRRVSQIAERNRGIPYEQVERDVAEAVGWARGKKPLDA